MNLKGQEEQNGKAFKKKLVYIFICSSWSWTRLSFEAENINSPTIA